MPHCPPELLDDLADALARVRTWAGVIEKKPGVFYLRREPFLHFHLIDGGRRRADVKGRQGWMSLDLPRPATAVKRRAFLRDVQARYDERSRRANASAMTPRTSTSRPGFRRSP